MIRPIGQNVLVQLKTQKDITSDSGIIIKTETQKSVVEDRQTNGKVIAIGDEVKDIKVNDIVYFDVVSGIDLENNQIMLRENTILGFIRN
jgi:chaperonin 10 Kd subunit